MTRYAPKILLRVERDSDLVPEIDVSFYKDLWYIYCLLLPEGQIREARDILVAAVEVQDPPWCMALAVPC
jgi:hypothetical protein